MVNLEFNGQDRLLSGVEKISKAVKSTLGAYGSTILMESKHHVGGMTITKDGITVAKGIDQLEDPIENLAVKMVREASLRTANDAGDGTTSSVVITEALVKSGLEAINKNEAVNVKQLIGRINEMKADLVKKLKKRSRKINKRNLKEVATISANNDKEIGGLIADAYKAIGVDGILTIEDSKTSETYYEVTDGIRIDKGYTSRLFVNDHKRDECVMKDALVLVSDVEINDLMHIEPILGKAVKENKPVLIIAECSKMVLNTLASNVAQRGFQFCHIMPPNFGERSKKLLSDIADVVGAKFISEETGDNIGNLRYEDLGRVSKCVVGSEETVLVSKEQIDLSDKISDLKVQIEHTPTKGEKEFLRKRIAGLAGGIGVIYVGGNSDIEQKEKKDRVDDAVCAVRSAIEEGISPGGGAALYHLAFQPDSSRGQLDQLAAEILNEGLRAPMRQILENAEIVEMLNLVSFNQGEGIDVRTREVGNMIKMGIIDPTKVVRNALENAVSVATTMMTTKGIITFVRDETNK
jgi:chaperonin GroEL